jgi:ATP-binding cassette subfamily B multidrug efflux pump
MANNSNKIDFSLLWRVIKLASPYRLIFIFAAVLAIVLAPLSVVRPQLIKVMVDDYIVSKDINGLLYIALIALGVLVIEGVVRYSFIYSTSWLGQSVIRDLRVNVFRKIMSLRLTYFDKTPIGTSTTRTINDIETVNSIFSRGVITIVADILAVFWVLGVMLYASWQLTLVCLTVLPLMIYASYLFKEKVKASYQIVRTQISRMNAFLQERITGMRVVQIFNVEQQEADKFRTINREYTQANLDSILYYAVFFPVVEIISAAALGLMIWYGANDILASGGVTPGDMVAFPIYLNMLFRPIRMLADKFNTLQMGLIAADRVFTVIDQDEHIENEGTLMAKKFEGKVAFENVGFSYDGENYVLDGLNFDIDPGKTLAIIGSTGSGKSTIINILNRFYDIQKGAIKVDGRNIREYELSSYRKRIAVVLQDVFLFSGTVFENITLRNEHITYNQVIKASRMIGAHGFIEKLPGGYDYQVMERGATLSMGQRQLISFVRALVFNPDILILDEATSSIDPESESIIQHAIEKLIEKRTSIIIAHRLSTIRNADNIMVLEKGKIVEYGPHDELIQSEDGRYRELYEMQFLETEKI